MLKENYVEGSGGGGGGGGNTPVDTPDNLFSEDIVEFALAVSEGPIRGLVQGAKSFEVGDTPLVSQTGTLNFQKFAIGVHPGYPEGVARNLKLMLGGESNNFNVGVQLHQDVVVTRQTQESLRNKIDRLEVRINFGRLLKTTKEGTFNNTARFNIAYKKITDPAWTNLDASNLSTETVEAKNFLISENPSVFQLQYVSDNSPVPAKYAVESTDLLLGRTVKVLRDAVTPDGEIHLTGKTSSGYVKEFKINVPRVNTDWMIKVVKFNPDDSTEEFCDMIWESFQCTTIEQKSYPDTAIVHGVGIATGQFSGLPIFSGVWDGLIVRVPTNYNPDLRTYNTSVPWDGSFKMAWTNNPAWVLYDLIVNTRYGLVAHYPHIDVNRFDFYEAARWCDEMVPSLLDNTVMEPRYTYNDVIAEPRDAREMLNFVAGSFNAFIWDDLTGHIHLKVDKDDPAITLFTPENVTEEGFSYSFTDVTTRVNDISVAYINESLNWNEDRRRIPGITTDPVDIARNGRIPLDFIAVGCTSGSEAVRKARYRLISALTETMMVNFTTTRLGATLDLYSVILIADPGMGWSKTGRIASHDSTFVYLRDPIYIERLVNYTMKFQTAHGPFDTTVTADQIGEVYRLRIQTGLPPYLPKNATFSLEEVGGFGVAKPFRVMSIEDVEGSPYLFSISAMELNRSKYSATENGVEVPELLYNFEKPGAVPAPIEVKISSGENYIEVAPNGLINYRMEISWTIQRGLTVDRFEAQYSKIDDSIWADYNPKGSTSFYVENVIPGQTYVARVRTVDPFGNKSPWTYSPHHGIFSTSKIPDPVISFEATGGVFQNKLRWEFNHFPTIKNVEIYSGIEDVQETSTLLVTLPYPADEYIHNNLGVGTRVFYWIRVFDKDGNVSPWFDPSISAVTSSDPSTLMSMLTASAEGDPPDTNFSVHPFIVGTVGGQSAVGLNGLLIVDGTVVADKIDTRGLSIKDAEGNIILSAGNSLDYSMVGGETRPVDNATRNEHRGDWTVDIPYILGDVVSDKGSSWTCVLAHTSSPLNRPPEYPATSNTNWNLNAETGANYSIVVESTNGDIFKVGQSLNTLLIAHVFRNGEEITHLVPESAFQWRRVSYFPQPSPNDDTTWNTAHASGYKQISVTANEIWSRATYHCDVLITD